MILCKPLKEIVKMIQRVLEKAGDLRTEENLEGSKELAQETCGQSTKYLFDEKIFSKFALLSGQHDLCGHVTQGTTFSNGQLKIRP